jgi:hypothetical protein
MNVATSSKFQQSIKQILENRVSQIHTALPGVVQSYDSSTQIAKVAPGVKKILVNGDEVELPVCTEVPVIMPGSGDAIIHFPIKKGDPVLLVFCQRAIDEFLLSGKISKPSKKRKHDLTDSVAIPGLLTFNNQGLAYNNEDLIVKKGSSKIVIKANGDVEINDDKIVIKNLTGIVEINGGNLVVLP